ncbi:MAG TPA: hypothetical protein VLG09_03855 [Candidatus Saccharimonadales bacterium]|nr:hypothetical protein [Candidatus Saccharimonadales bacterium]
MNDEHNASRNGSGNLADLIQRTHDNMDCLTFHECTEDFVSVMNAYQLFFQRAKEKFGARAAATQLMDNSITQLAAAVVENLTAMNSHPISGDPDSIGEQTKYLWLAITTDFARCLSEMTEGRINMEFNEVSHEVIDMNAPQAREIN